ncbi:MAG TPA: universal stress protein, partial [Solirubrobacteraceae bacterium]|nr:universal stress protein [Solirubrobacteraceae bacterium]
PDQPILFCYDGSEESQRALASVVGMLASRAAVVLTVWQPLSARLSETGGFGAFALDDETEIDEDERSAATAAAEDGAARARSIGMEAQPRVEEADGPVWQTIIDVADELDAGLIVCGTRGRGAIRTALLGSTSRALLQHAGRPVLVSPEPRGG